MIGDQKRAEIAVAGEGDATERSRTNGWTMSSHHAILQLDAFLNDFDYWTRSSPDSSLIVES